MASVVSFVACCLLILFSAVGAARLAQDVVESDLLHLLERPYDFPPTPLEGLVKTKPTRSLRVKIGRGRVFAHFSRVHRQALQGLLQIFRNAKTPAELRNSAYEWKGNVNENLFVYALSRAIIENEALRKFKLPSPVEMFPEEFVPTSKILEMFKAAKLASSHQESVVVVHIGPETTGLLTSPEQRVAYWREDFALNSHHWHWHLFNPFSLNVTTDRKGELFYYMHRQMVARYDAERLSTGLNRVRRFSNWREALADGYFPKLTTNNTGTAWGTRQDNSFLRNCKRAEFDPHMRDVGDLELYHGRIVDAIHQGALISREGKWVAMTDDIPADQKRGIELLSDAFEADSDRSVNFPYYGEVHNFGHMLISGAHDPEYLHKEELGVMSDNKVAIRDPAFFRWHKYVDDVYQRYKLTQAPYTRNILSLDWAKLETVTLGSIDTDYFNEIYTGWNTTLYNASKGIDFGSKLSMMLNVTHLSYQPFQYFFKVNNTLQEERNVTVRIFLAPRHNERGLDMDYLEQRLLWAEMDKFVYLLNPGENLFYRSSLNSTVTTRNVNVIDDPNDEDWYMHGCGLPQHLLIPRGKKSCMTFQLFVMLTDWNQDKVSQPSNHDDVSAPSICGVKGHKYPDSRTMGFPFDRDIALNDTTVNSTLDLKELHNVQIIDVAIKFTNQAIGQFIGRGPYCRATTPIVDITD